MDNGKIITIQLECVPLQNGKFSAKFVVHEPVGGSKNVSTYLIEGVYDTREEALIVAEGHATQQFREDFGPEVGVEIERMR